MKIISKFKDYYDYYQGIFGIDEKLVLDRRDVKNLVTPSVISESLCTYTLSICNKKYTIYLYENKFYHTLEELNILSIKLFKNGKDGLDIPGTWRWRPKSANKFTTKDWDKLNHTLVGKDMVNSKLREPILIETYKGWDKNVVLKDFAFHKVIDAKDIFIEISNFLGWLIDNPPLPDNQTNKGKITSHGFDMKKSFRHRK